MNDDKDNFREELTVEDANKVDLQSWVFVKLSDSRGYCFKRRKK